MTGTELVNKAYLLATGQHETLTSADDDFKKLLAIANIYLLSWAAEPGVDWESLYDPAVNCGTISATDTFDLDDSIRVISNKPGDYIRIQKAGDSSKYYNFTLVSPTLLKTHVTGNYCARVGRTLKFNRTFDSDSNEFGGTLLVPGFTTPDPLTASDDVPVDDPNWLVYMSAAEWVRNDITLSQNYPGLIALANQSMDSMKEANQPQEETIFKAPAMRSPVRW